MSLAVFPSNVRGLTYPVEKGSEFNTILQTAPNLLETAIIQSYNPVWNWQLIYEFLFDDEIPGGLGWGQARVTDYRLLQGFLLAQAGKGGEFLYDDPTDDYVGPGVIAGVPNVPMAQLAVVTDGAGRCYSPVQRNMGGQFLEDITDLRSRLTGYGNASGTLGWSESRPLAWHYESMKWSDFAMAPTARPLPADAVIQGIYPVFIGSAVFASVTTMAFRSGPGMPLSGGVPVGTLFTSPSNPDNTSFSNTLFYGASIGTSLSALAAQEILALTNCSLFLGPTLTDAVEVTAVGYAIYYTSATPTTDAQMAPPFAVPAGQGLAWALPFGGSCTGNTGAQGTAIVAISAPLITPILVYDNGVLQVAGIDYVLNGPGGALPGYSFMGLYLGWTHPPTGPVTADFYFYFRVRFAEDKQDFSQFLAQFWTAAGSEAGNSTYIGLKSSRPVQA
jgi:hypothetical protein